MGLSSNGAKMDAHSYKIVIKDCGHLVALLELLHKITPHIHQNSTNWTNKTNSKTPDTCFQVKSHHTWHFEIHSFSTSWKDQKRMCNAHCKAHIKMQLVNTRFKKITQKCNHIEFILATPTLYILLIMSTIQDIDFQHNQFSNHYQWKLKNFMIFKTHGGL